jgi:hypothetical protein
MAMIMGAMCDRAALMVKGVAHQIGIFRHAEFQKN